MTILMWISRWQNEMELMIMGLQIILFLFLTIGVFCIVRQQKKANRCRRRLELYLKKHMDKPGKKEEKSVSPEKVQNKNYIFRKIDSMQNKRLYKNLFSVLKY